jgi:hypothetical protein
MAVRIDWSLPIETVEEPPRPLTLMPDHPKVGCYSRQGRSCPPEPRRRIARVASVDPLDPDRGMWFAEDGTPVGIAPEIRNRPTVRPCPVCGEDRHEPCPFDNCPWRPLGAEAQWPVEIAVPPREIPRRETVAHG